MSDGKVRLAVIGTGGIAKSHLNGYRQLRDAGYDEFEIVALCDNNDDRLREYAGLVQEQLGTEPCGYSEVEQLCEASDEIDAVDNCTPHAFHHSTAIPCLEAGLDVMVEKPCGITIKAADKIIAAAEENDCILAVAEQVRRGIRARCMHWAINDAEMIGEPRFLSVTGFSSRDFRQEVDKYAMGWRCLKLLTGGGMIFDAGVHFSDMMYYLFGRVERVSAWTGTFQDVDVPSPELGTQKMDVEDTWFSIITFESGLVCNWAWSFSARGEPVANQMLYASGGSARDRGGWMHTFQNGGDLTFSDGTQRPYEEIESAYRDQLDEDTRTRLFPHGVENDTALECWDFVDAVQKRRAPEIDGYDSKWTKAMSLALYESSLAGETVRVQDVYDGNISAYQDPINEYWDI